MKYNIGDMVYRINNSYSNPIKPCKITAIKITKDGIAYTLSDDCTFREEYLYPSLEAIIKAIITEYLPDYILAKRA